MYRKTLLKLSRSLRLSRFNPATPAGAFMFIAIEGGNENDTKKKTDNQREDLSREMWEKMREINVLNRTAFNDL